ncbi:DegT/DnrJ/EryC1/StrS family aminotransferase [Mucilaginibacter sp. HD30]
MIPRGKLYISYSELLTGLYYCLKPGSEKAVQPEDNNLVCLSVRTGFDMLLSVLNFAPGSEMLVTDINIPDMFRIIAAHDIKAIGLAVEKHTLNIAAAQFEAAITPNTRAILITHLFGGIMETDEIIAIAKKHKLIIFEDCAQAYAGDVYKGNPASDIVMFSFGFIKTNTAVSGAVIKINDEELYTKATALNEQYIRQNTSRYFKKLLKVSFVKLLNSKAIYTLFYKLVMALGKNFEQVLSGFTKGFPGDDIFTQIRFRPCIANKLLLQRKLKGFSQHSITERMQLANDVLENIPDRYKIGSKNIKQTYWVLPVETNDPDGLINYLRSNGFDASQKASSLVHLESARNTIGPDDLNLEKLVYLPSYPAMSRSERKRLGELISNFA